MNIAQTISNQVEKLPLKLQEEVLNFVKYLVYKSGLEAAAAGDKERSDMENQAISANSQHSPAAQRKTRRSILELRGLGRHLWKDTSVKDYLNAERDSWDG